MRSALRARKALGVLAAFIVLGAFIAFVWPTLYRPLAIIPPPLAPGDNPPVAARQNRLTGRVQWLLFPHGWVSVQQ
jgi:hypothetical protein